MLFASAQLVSRIERAECRLVTDCATAVRRNDPGVLMIPVDSGIATFAGNNSPLNKVVGLGFNPPPDQPQDQAKAQSLFESKLEEIERLWSERAAPVQVELSTYADPSIGATLSKRGYHLRGFENVLGLPLPRQSSPQGHPTSDIHAEINPPDNIHQWLDTVVTGFATPDTQGVASHESYPREAIEKAMDDMASAEGFTHVIARRSGVVAGGASLKISDRIAQLCGAATLPEHRRRGVQGALFEFRLDAATRAGCDLAVVTTLPGSKSQENAHRRGFSLLYTRAILVLESSSRHAV